MRRALLPFAAVALIVAGCLSSPVPPYPCATDGTCPGGALCVQDVGCVQGTSCHVELQNCEGQASKCAFVRTANGLDQPICVSRGSKQAGEACTRDAAAGDDCGVGLVCDETLSADGSHVCRQMCGASSGVGCSPGMACVFPFDDPQVGLCVEPCTLGTCGEGKTCRPAPRSGFGSGTTLVCAKDGTRALGEACDDLAPCAQGLLCGPTSRCVAACSSSVPCTAPGAVCGSIAADYGYCGCTLFGACPDGTTCRPPGPTVKAATPVCEPASSSSGSCTLDVDCAAGFVCASGECRALCDDTHPCRTNGGSCQPTGSLPKHGGVCTY